MWSRSTKMKVLVGILSLFLVALALGVWFGARALRRTEAGSAAWDFGKIMLTSGKKIHADLEGELQKIKEASEPLTLADLALPSVADDENAAVIYAKAFEQLNLSDSDIEMLGSLTRNHVAVPDREIPLAELGRIVERNPAAIELLVEAAKRPRCRFAIDWDAGIETELPHLPQLKNSAYLLAAKILWHADRNQMRQALATARVSLAIGDSVADEGTVISQLFRYAITGTTLTVVQYALHERSAPTGSCRKLYGYLGEMEFMDSFVETMSRERVMGISGFALWRQQITEKKAERGGFSWTPLDKLTDYDQVQYLRLMSEVIAVAESPYRNSREAFSDIKRRLSEDVPVCLLTRTLLPVTWAPVIKRDVIIARVGLAQVALALKAYKNKKGRYPESLAKLREVIDWGKLPEDPFSAEDFIYRHEGEGFLVYSIGVNLIDDGGQVEQDWEEGDIVWRCER